MWEIVLEFLPHISICSGAIKIQGERKFSDSDTILTIQLSDFSIPENIESADSCHSVK